MLILVTCAAAKSKAALKAKLEGEDRSKLQERCLAQALELKEKDSALLQARRRTETLQKESGTFAEALKREGAARAKLENLCRELQKQNKRVAEESRRLAEEDCAQRSAISARFESGLNDITERLEQQGNDRIKALTENDALRAHQEQLVARAELMQQHFDKQAETWDLQRQLLEARLKEQQHVAAAAEAKA